MTNADDENERRVAVIREAVRLISVGTGEINDVFSRARGPLPKKSMRVLHTRLKELRSAAETTEDGFRDWTVELTGKPNEAEQAQHDELRALFEVEVAAIQRCVARIAEELRSGGSRRSAETVPPGGCWGATAKAQSLEATLSSIGATTMPAAMKARKAEGRLASHARMADALRQIAREEESACEIHNVAESCDEGDQSPVAKPRASAALCPFWVKAMIFIALTSVGYTAWSHARILFHDAAREELRWALARGDLNMTGRGVRGWTPRIPVRHDSGIRDRPRFRQNGDA